MNSSASALPAPEPETGSRNEIPLADDDDTAEAVSTDEVAIILGFLSHADIMRARVCKTWRDAATKTLVPLCDFKVDSERSYNAMRIMATALPNLQQISIRGLGCEHKYSDGEDADEARAATTANYTTHDIDIISSFTKLRVLQIGTIFSLNGRYPALFNFPLLEKLSIKSCDNLRVDLDMLEGMPSLKELNLDGNPDLTGNLRSLRVLKETLEKVDFNYCPKIRGDLMDLADFPLLKKLSLFGSIFVTGDIRDIREHSFPALESLCLPSSVTGGSDYQFQSISDVPSFMHAIHLLLQRTPTLFEENNYDLSDAFGWSLSEDSPDWYDRDDGSGSPFPPFVLRFIQAGSRLGWSWCSYDDESGDYEASCEINWLDPEPNSESDDYETYIEELKHFEGEINTDFYRGYYEPPTEMEYRRPCEGL